MENKICTTCNEEKSIDSFKKCNYIKGGIRNQCKVCCRLLEKKYKNHLIVKDSMKLCTKCNIEKPESEFKSKTKIYINATCKDCCIENKNKRIEDLKNRKTIEYPSFKTCSKCKIKKSKDDFNIVKTNASGLSSACNKCKQIYRSTKEYKKRRMDGQKSKLKNDPMYKIYRSTQSRFHTALRRSKIKKSIRTLDIIGCTIDELKIHLESNFKEGMTWENYGLKGWHIDHIKPCKLFDFTIEEEIKKCWHYTNLQPLWWWENIKKRDKWQNTTSE
jgi:hypothetical protein